MKHSRNFPQFLYISANLQAILISQWFLFKFLVNSFAQTNGDKYILPLQKSFGDFPENCLVVVNKNGAACGSFNQVFAYNVYNMAFCKNCNSLHWKKVVGKTSMARDALVNNSYSFALCASRFLSLHLRKIQATENVGYFEICRKYQWPSFHICVLKTLEYFSSALYFFC